MVGGNEDNGNLVQKVPCIHCCTQGPQHYSRPLLTHASTGDSWTLMGKSGSVTCGVTAPFFCILVHTRFCLCPPGVYFPVLCKFWQLYGGVNGTSSKRKYAIPKSAAPRAPVPAADHHRPAPPQQTLKHSCLSFCGVPGSWCIYGLFDPLSVSGGNGV